MAAGTERVGEAGSDRGPVGLARVRTIGWTLTRETTAICFRYRVTGLAAEAGFFLLLSLPPLVLALVGGIGYLDEWLGADTVAQVKDRVIELSGHVLTASSVKKVITPTLEDVLGGGRPDLISIGFLIALWSGSRALNVFIDTISIMYGLGGRRGIIRSRILSFSLYVASTLVGAIIIPLVLAGPSLLSRVLPEQVDSLDRLYWPVASLLSVVSLTSLYHVSVPVRTPWKRDLPGAGLTLLIWFGGSFVVRKIISISVGGTSIYGPLAAPIVLMIWLYVLAIAVLIGAALNAAIESVWPRREIEEAREHRVPAPAKGKANPGYDTGEVELPPNRPPGKNPLAGSRDPR